MTDYDLEEFREEILEIRDVREEYLKDHFAKPEDVNVRLFHGAGKSHRSHRQMLWIYHAALMGYDIKMAGGGTLLAVGEG